MQKSAAPGRPPPAGKKRDPSPAPHRPYALPDRLPGSFPSGSLLPRRVGRMLGRLDAPSSGRAGKKRTSPALVLCMSAIRIGPLPSRGSTGKKGGSRRNPLLSVWRGRLFVSFGLTASQPRALFTRCERLHIVRVYIYILRAYILRAGHQAARPLPEPLRARPLSPWGR